MKALLILATFAFSFSISAAPVDGKIFYKTKSGELIKRSVTLEVPSRGQGEVVLSGERFEWRTTNFWTTRRNGEILFTAVFQTEFMEKTSTIALEGTYLKGSNKILYTGNFYKKDGHGDVDRDISDFQYNGGFAFKFDRE